MRRPQFVFPHWELLYWMDINTVGAIPLKELQASHFRFSFCSMTQSLRVPCLYIVIERRCAAHRRRRQKSFSTARYHAASIHTQYEKIGTFEANKQRRFILNRRNSVGACIVFKLFICYFEWHARTHRNQPISKQTVTVSDAAAR